MEALAKSPRLRLGLFISFEPLSLRSHLLKNPDHDTRRTVIREWMALPKDKRRSKDQALSFAAATSSLPLLNSAPPLVPRLRRQHNNPRSADI
jgi:hypothetical protein